MSPRFLGAALVCVKSFARIAETNLKKQGVLPLTFADAADYERVLESDRVATRGLAELQPGSVVTLVLQHADGKSEEIAARHTLTTEQVEWFEAGSAMAWIGAR